MTKTELIDELEGVCDKWDGLHLPPGHIFTGGAGATELAKIVRAILDRAKEHDPKHPLFAGYVIDKEDGEEREFLHGSQVDNYGGSICPYCKRTWKALAPKCEYKDCGATQHNIGKYSYWLAPKKQQQKQEPQCQKCEEPAAAGFVFCQFHWLEHFRACLAQDTKITVEPAEQADKGTE